MIVNPLEVNDGADPGQRPHDDEDLRWPVDVLSEVLADALLQFRPLVWGREKIQIREGKRRGQERGGEKGQ